MGSIKVYVDNALQGMLTQCYSQGKPDNCSSDGTLPVTVTEGTHSYGANSTGGASWGGSFTVTAGSCYTFRLSYSTCMEDESLTDLEPVIEACTDK